MVEKPCGVVVHHGAGIEEGTIEDELALSFKTEEERLLMQEYRYGIVHRLDKDTSGLMVIAKNPETCRFLINEFKAHRVDKVYTAIVKGMVEKHTGIIETGIKRSDKNRKKFTVCSIGDGKEAKSEYTVLRYFSTLATLVDVKIYTGRTHQIRVHMLSINHPVLGDVIYSRKDKNIPDFGLMLHAKYLEFNHPNGERLKFQSNLPERFKKTIEFLEK